MPRQQAAEESKQVGRRVRARWNREAKVEAVLRELQKLKWWPEVPPKEWRAVYERLGFGEMGPTSGKIYLGIKEKVKYAR